MTRRNNNQIFKERKTEEKGGIQGEQSKIKDNLSHQFQQGGNLRSQRKEANPPHLKNVDETKNQPNSGEEQAEQRKTKDNISPRHSSANQFQQGSNLRSQKREVNPHNLKNVDETSNSPNSGEEQGEQRKTKDNINPQHPSGNQFQQGGNLRSQKKEVIQFHLKKPDDAQYHGDNRSKQPYQQQQQNPRTLQGEGQLGGQQSSSPSGMGSEGMFLNQLSRSEQNRNEKQRGANQHSQLMKRIKQYEQNANPNESDMRSVIECFNSCGFYDKAITTYSNLKQILQGAPVNETVLNAVFESKLKSSHVKLNKIDEFFHLEFVETKMLKLVYKDNIQQFLLRVCADTHVSLDLRLASLSTFIESFKEQVAISSFQGIDLSCLSTLFSDATTKQYVSASKILADLMGLAIGTSQGSQVHTNKFASDQQIRFQLEIINTKKIFNHILGLKEYNICKDIIIALSKGNLLLALASINNKPDEHQKLIDYKDLIDFCIATKQTTHFWVDVVSKRVDFESFTSCLSTAFLELRMNVCPPQVFSREDLYDFFLKISNYGALSPSQVYTLMQISIYLKEFPLAIELFTNHQKYTNRRRDLFVYELMLNVVNQVNLRIPDGKNSKDQALHAFRKLYTDAESQTGKQMGFMASKLHEIKSLILDQSIENAYSIFNDRFLKDSIANYQALKMQYFLLLLLQKQDEKGEITHSENNITRFISTLAPKQLLQLWSDERNDSPLVKQLANKDTEYNAFVKRLEVQKYYGILKRDLNSGYYTLEDRRDSLKNVLLNEYERYVIDNFETLDPEFTLDSKLKNAVLDGIYKIKQYEELHQKRDERRRLKRADKDSANPQVSMAVQKYEKDLEDSQIEINKIFGRPIDTPVNIPELYKKYDLEDKHNNKFIERYVANLKNADFNQTKTYKMKFMTIETYKDTILAFPELLEQASILARPSVPPEANLVFDLMTWGAENLQPLAIQLGEAYCDMNGLSVPVSLTEKINKAMDPYNDSEDFLSQLSYAKRLLGDINRERMYHIYTHFSQKPQFEKAVNTLAEEDRYRDEGEYVLQQEASASRLLKYGIPYKYIQQNLTKDSIYK